MTTLLTSPGEKKLKCMTALLTSPEKKKPKCMTTLLISPGEEKTQMHDRPSLLTGRRKYPNA
jgi:hypothetical protein